MPAASLLLRKPVYRPSFGASWALGGKDRPLQFLLGFGFGS